MVGGHNDEKWRSMRYSIAPSSFSLVVLQNERRIMSDSRKHQSSLKQRFHTKVLSTLRRQPHERLECSATAVTSEALPAPVCKAQQAPLLAWWASRTSVLLVDNLR